MSLFIQILSRVKCQRPFVVHAVDAKTNETVQGIIKINNIEVGTTDTPFTYTVDGTVSRVGVVRLSSPNYPDEPLQLGIETVEPVTRAVPSTVTLNSEVKIVINATDPLTKDPDITISFVPVLLTKLLYSGNCFKSSESILATFWLRTCFPRSVIF